MQPFKSVCLAGKMPFVTVVIPVLNEEKHLSACLRSLIPQIAEGAGEIIVVDGGSTDRSREIAGNVSRQHSAVSIISNPNRLQAAGFNQAARLADSRSQVLVRADAHAGYPQDFIVQCVKALCDMEATSVVVPMTTVGTSPFQRAVAAAQNSRVGNGGSTHRLGGHSGFVEHGHHAAFRREFFLQIGGYDERFTHNEDAELDIRALAEGGRIWMCADATITYYPRSKPLALARQYYRHGRGRCRTLLLHQVRPRLRQLAPVGVLVGSIASLVVAPRVPSALLFPLAYISACGAFALTAALKGRDMWLLAVAPASMIMHLAWGAGLVHQLTLSGVANLRRFRLFNRPRR